jgi:CubicO group peptidase (beta-lactamase class C family)
MGLCLLFALPAALFLTPVTVGPAHRLPLTAYRSQIDSAGLARLVDSAIARGMAAESIPGAAFILVQNGRVVLAKGYGKADVATGRAWDPERTIFPIASITKVFTATAVMQLVDRGRIDLNADVNRYLRSVRVPATYSPPVTAAQLLSHTAGFDELPGRRVRSATELVPLKQFLARRLVRIRPPGTMTSYSSYGIALAGLLVEDVSGVAYEDYLRQQILKPLSMTSTHVASPDESGPDLAVAYEPEGDRLVPVPYEIYQTPSTSSLLSTVADMGHFLIAHLQKGCYGSHRILSDTAAALMQRQYATIHPRIPGWTLGFQVNDLNGRYLIEHGGDIGGFSSLLTLLPREGVGFFVVHHLEGRKLRFDLRQLILDRYFPFAYPPEPPRPDSLAAPRLRRFAGTYRASIYCHSCKDGAPNVQDFEITAGRDGTISLWGNRWIEAGPLYFVSADGRKHIGFAEDSTGRIVAVTGGSWRVLERLKAVSGKR